MAANDNIRIDTVSGRKKLTARREPYWQKLGTGQALGARKSSDEKGTCYWIAKLNIGGKRRYKRLGDDKTKLAEYRNRPMDFDLASKQAHAWIQTTLRASKNGADPDYTVQTAIDDYVAHVRAEKGDKAADLVPGRLTKHLPERMLTQRVVALTTKQLKAWMQGQVRSEEQFDADKVRASRDTANRRLAVLKACLNMAFRDGMVADDSAWRRVQRFEKTSAQRKLFLTQNQVATLLAQTKGALHSIIKAGVLTGARRGELFALTARDFNLADGTLNVADGKTGQRTVYLSDDGVEFFQKCARSKLPEAPLLPKNDGSAWPEDDLTRPFKAAVRAAKLPPETTFYSLRHYHISRALVDGVNAQVIAENCGTSLKMIEKHYGKFLKSDRRAMLNEVAL